MSEKPKDADRPPPIKDRSLKSADYATPGAALNPMQQDIHQQLGDLISGGGGESAARNRLAELLVGTSGLKEGRNEMSLAGLTVDPWIDIVQGGVTGDPSMVGRGMLNRIDPARIGKVAKFAGRALDLEQPVKSWARQGVERGALSPLQQAPAPQVPTSLVKKPEELRGQFRLPRGPEV